MSDYKYLVKTYKPIEDSRYTEMIADLASINPEAAEEAKKIAKRDGYSTAFCNWVRDRLIQHRIIFT